MTTSVSAGWSAWPSHVPDSASRGAPTGMALVTAPASLSAAPSTASTDSSAPTAPVAKFSPRAISISQVRGSHYSVRHVEIVHYASWISPLATLIMWFQLRSPELAEDFERLMTEDRAIVRGSLDTVSNWRLTRPADVPGQSIGQADYAAGGRARTVHRPSRLRADRRDLRSGALRATGERTRPTLGG